jgi:hypothetical protein
MVFISISGMAAVENACSNAAKPKSVTLDVSIPIGHNSFLLGTLSYFHYNNTIMFDSKGDVQYFHIEAMVSVVK